MHCVFMPYAHIAFNMIPFIFNFLGRMSSPEIMKHFPFNPIKAEWKIMDTIICFKELVYQEEKEEICDSWPSSLGL